MSDVEIELGRHAGRDAQPIVLQTNRLCYHVSVSDKSKPRRFGGLLSRPMKPRKILDEISLLARPGELTAIMGPSGGGKTTLLELISARVTGNTTGEMTINGDPISRSLMSKVAGYVKQKDILLASSTVREAIQFSADIRLPPNMPAKEKKEKVESVIEKLGLTKCADTRVGDELHRGVSGGELKRAAIGVELVTQPNLLFLDEPTSGLDSSSAYTIVNILKRLSRDDGTTVICTLHQPRANIFNMFDRLILMHSGRIIYQGPPGDAIQFFAECGHACPPYTNPADFFMDVITETDIPDESEDLIASDPASTPDASPLPSPHLSPSGSEHALLPGSNGKSKKLKKSELLTRSPGSDSLATAIEVATSTQQQEPMSVDQMVEHWRSSKKSKRSIRFREELAPVDVKRRMNRKPGLALQTWTLFGRSMRNNFRNPLILWAQLFQHLLLSLFMGFMYLRIGQKKDSLQDLAAAIFFCLLNVSWVPALTAAFVFPAERPLFNRERAGGFYKTLPYYLTTTLSDVPMQFLLVLLNSALTYWMLALKPSFYSFVIFTIIFFLALMAAQSVALFLSAISPTADVANILATLGLMLFMAFGGYLLSIKNVPPYFYPFLYASPYRYAYRALMRNEFIGRQFTCNPTVLPCPAGNYTILTGPTHDFNTTGPLLAPEFCTFPCTPMTGKDALQQFGLQGSSVLQDIMILLGMSVIARIFIYLALEFVQIGGS